MYLSLSLTQKRKKIEAESSDWRRAWICPSDRTAGQMRNRLGYRGTLPRLEILTAIYVKQ